MDYTIDDYNVTIWRGFVREDGKVLKPEGWKAPQLEKFL